jgi:hypothetical protein
MSEERVGIFIEVFDKASSVLKGIGAAGKTGLDAVRSASERAGNALKTVGMAATFLNQGLELAKKGWELFRMAVVDNIAAMVEYRGEQDVISKRFAAMADDAKFTRAVIADLLTPAILGLSDAFQEAGNSIVDYINVNRRLIATNIIEFLAETARLLTAGVGEAVIWVSRAVSGLIEMWNLLKAAIETAVAGALQGVERLLSGLGAVAAWANRRELATAMEETAATVQLLGDTFSQSADENIEKMKEQVAAQAALEKGVRSVQATVIDFVDNNAVPAMLRWADSWDGVRRKAADTEEAVVKTAKESKSAIEAVITATSNWGQVIGNTLQSFTTGMGAAFGKMITDSENAGIHFQNAVIDAVTASIMAYASAGAAASAAANAGIPGIGWIAALAAGAAVSAAIKELVADVPAKAQAGGILGGMRTGRDSALAAVMPGVERVLSPRQTTAFEKMVESLDRGRGTGGGNMVSIQANIQALDVGEPELKKRVLLSLGREMEELVQDRLLLSNVVTTG